MENITTLFIGIGLGALLVLVLKKDHTADDPTGEIKKQIADKLDKAISDIKSTV